MPTKMRTTTDLYTGRPFRWNTTALQTKVDGTHFVVPARCTDRCFVWLNAARTPAKLLAELNRPKDGNVGRHPHHLELESPR